jgi:hypothetical protein
MPDRVQEAFLGSAVGIMAVDAGFRSRPDFLMGAQELLSFCLVTPVAEFAGGRVQDTLQGGPVSAVTFHAVFDRRLVRTAVLPVPGDFPMAGKAEQRLTFF